jgi:hypothetical protein
MARKKNKMFQAPMIKLSAPPKKYWQNKSINTIEKSTSDLLLSQTCIIKAMTCSLASISSPAQKLAFYGEYRFVLSISFWWYWKFYNRNSGVSPTLISIFVLIFFCLLSFVFLPCHFLYI